MFENKEELKNKIIYRSSYRGSKEMDLLISSFVKSIINNLNYEELLLLSNLINIDDENLFKLNKKLKTSINIEDSKFVKLFQNFSI